MGGEALLKRVSTHDMCSKTVTNNHPIERQEITYCDEDPTSGFTSLGASDDQVRQKKMLIAHGTLGALAFVIFFPAGAIAIRLASFPGVVWFHAAFQVFAYLVYIAAFGLGVYLANEMELVSSLFGFQLVMMADLTIARRIPPNHRHSRPRDPLLPAHFWFPPSCSVQEAWNAHFLVVRAYLAWPNRHHPWHHQWRPGFKAG